MTITRLDSSLNAIVDPDASLEILWQTTGFLEGPVWFNDGADGALFFSDIPGNAILRWTKRAGVAVHFAEVAPPDVEGKRLQLPDREVHLFGPNGLARDTEGRLTFCSYGAGEVVRMDPDKQTCLASHYEGSRLNTPNDLVFRSDGVLYFTDSTPGHADDRVATTGVYRLAGGVLDLIVDHFATPNGLAFSPDERFLYVNDTRPKTISRFRVAADGSLSDEQPFADLNGLAERGAPDGMKVDLHGNVFCTGPGGLWIYDAGGKHLGIIRTPEQLTNLTFGGADRQWLFLTGPSYLYRIHLARPAAH